MAAEVIVGEIISSLLAVILLWAKEKGLSDAQCNTLILDLMIKIRQTKPQDLPRV